MTVEESEGGKCAVAHATTVSTYTGFKLPLKYVYNAHVDVHGPKSVDDFNRYVANTHESVAGSYKAWAGWDHWLDYHVGLQYGQEYNDAANRTSYEVNKRLLAGGVPVGQRYETGGQMHWYSGFEGAITVEFCTVPNAADMDGISENNEAEICTCRADNNLQQYEDDTGKNCTTGAVTF